VFTTPMALLVPLNSAFKAYLINMNGLHPTLCPPLSEGTDTVKLDKIKLLRDLANKVEAGHYPPHQNPGSNLVAQGPLQEWHSMPSTPVGGKHDTAMLISLPPNDTMCLTHASARKDSPYGWSQSTSPTTW
jgi:hypothetical protein